MINNIHNNRNFYEKSVPLSLMNKSSSDSNQTAISNGQKNSFENNNINSSFYFKNKIQKSLKKKYDMTPFKFSLISIQNFIDSKYCREIAVFKEKLLFNFEEEFLRRIYLKNESIQKIHNLFSFYYNSKLFWKPTFRDLILDESLQKYYEKKTQIFYRNYYNLYIKNNKRKQNDIEQIIFSEKIRNMVLNEDSCSKIIIREENSSFSSNYSFEKSIIKILNEKPKEKEIQLMKTNDFKIEKKSQKLDNIIRKKKSINLSKKRSISFQKEKKNLKKKNNKNFITKYNKYSRNLNNYYPLKSENNIYLPKNNYQMNKISKFFLSQNINHQIYFNNKKDNLIKQNIEFPFYNIEKRFSVPLKNIKKNKPKFSSYVCITHSKNDKIISNKKNNEYINLQNKWLLNKEYFVYKKE